MSNENFTPSERDFLIEVSQWTGTTVATVAAGGLGIVITSHLETTTAINTEANTQIHQLEQANKSYWTAYHTALEYPRDPRSKPAASLDRSFIRFDNFIISLDKKDLYHNSAYNPNLPGYVGAGSLFLTAAALVLSMKRLRARVMHRQPREKPLKLKGLRDNSDYVPVSAHEESALTDIWSAMDPDLRNRLDGG